VRGDTVPTFLFGGGYRGSRSSEYDENTPRVGYGEQEAADEFVRRQGESLLTTRSLTCLTNKRVAPLLRPSHGACRAIRCALWLLTNNIRRRSHLAEDKCLDECGVLQILRVTSPPQRTSDFRYVLTTPFPSIHSLPRIKLLFQKRSQNGPICIELRRSGYGFSLLLRRIYRFGMSLRL
jgi:hypothetical protein